MFKNIKKQRIVLLDSHAILHRAYHALPEFTSPKGEPTGALYGLTTFLLKIIDELKPVFIIASYDLPEPTMRHKAFVEYKATRAKTDDALIAQFEHSKKLLDAFGIPRIEIAGYEADDILGTLAELFKKDDSKEIVIASGDMDTLQLVDGSRVQVYTLKRGVNDTILYDEEAVKSRYGFGPSLVADYKGLRGDPSDNIPGIRGIGEKTATTLITTFGGIDAIYKTLKKSPEKFSNAGITPRIVGLLKDGEDEARFSKELATIYRDVPLSQPSLTTPWTESIDFQKTFVMFSDFGFRALAQRFKAKLGDGENSKATEIVNKEDVSDAEIQETALALWLVRSDITNPTKEDIFEYVGTQSFVFAKKKIFEELEEKGLKKVYTTIELPLIPIILSLESKGILLDTAYLKKISKRYHSDLDELAKNIYRVADVEFNLNSPKQLGEVLFEKLGIGSGKGKRTATGQRSTREDELRKYEHEEPIVKDILEYRELQKLLSTYIDNLPSMVDEQGRLHAHFSQTGTSTGRMSSQSPNMQNIPIKSTRGMAIRKAIIAPKGSKLISADYSQIELRVVAILSKDKKLLEYFTQGVDIHTAVASQVFGTPPELVTKEMRRKAKVINFGILYGMGVNALAVATNTSRSEASMYLKEYFKKFEGVRGYMDEIKRQVHALGYTETLFGRKRYYEGAKSPLPHIQAQAERMAMNAPIQGTSADIIKIATIRTQNILKEKNLHMQANLIAQIHDELLYEVKDEVVDDVVRIVRDTMESVLPSEKTHGVPLVVDVEVGQNWGEMKKIDS